MYKFINLSLVILLVVSCKITADGVIQTSEELTLSKSGSKKRVKFDSNGNVTKIKKPVKIPAGRYKGEFKVSSKKTTKLKFHNVPGQSKKVIIEFSIPKGSKLPASGGSFSYTAQQVRQPYGVAGRVDVEVTRSGQTQSSESCTYYDQEYRCRTVTDQRCRTRRDGTRVCRPVRRQVCNYVTVTRYGTQEVTYHYVYTKRDFEVNLLSPTTRNFVSTFTGTHNQSDKVYDYRSQCFGPRHGRHDRGHGRGHGRRGGFGL